MQAHAKTPSGRAAHQHWGEEANAASAAGPARQARPLCPSEQGAPGASPSLSLLPGASLWMQAGDTEAAEKLNSLEG